MKKIIKNKKTKNNNINIIMFTLFLLIAIITLSFSITINGQKNVNYQENSNIDYKVYLKENDFYEEEYLGKDKIYVASLIKKVDIDFNYIFKIDIPSDIDFNYDIIGTLIIADSSGKNIFFEKGYTLLKDTKAQLLKGKTNTINKTVSIDYNYYNSLANKFKAKYGLNTTSSLRVKFKVNDKSKNNNLKLNSNSEMEVTIPLSEREVNITMDYNEINKDSKTISNNSLIIKNKKETIIGIISLLIALLFLIKIIKTHKQNKIKKSKYDKKIKKILREYDRLIVNTTTKPDLKNKKIIKIDSFSELLDVRDNLKLPIKYYIIKEHTECNMYIDHEKELYLLVIKSSQIDKEELK